MPVWWGVFAYSLFVAAFGSMIYKNRQLDSDGINTVSSGMSIDNRSIGLFFAFATFALAAYFIGMRSWMFDSGEYQFAYERYSTDLSQITDIISGKTNEKGPLFNIILVLFKHFTNGTYTDWFFLIGFIQLVAIAYFFYKYSSNYVFTIFLFITTGGFMWLVNGVRQFLAVSLILFFVDWIINRKIFSFLLIVFIAYFIHSSALLWVPFCFIVHFKPWSKKFILSSSLITMVVFILSTSSSFLNDYGYSYLSNNPENNGVNPFRVLVMAVPVVIGFVGRKEIEKKSTPFIDLCTNISVVCLECYIVGMFTSGVIGRLPVYFVLFNWILLPWLLKNALDEETRKIITFLCILGFMAFFYYDMYIVGNGIYHSTVLDLDFSVN